MPQNYKLWKNKAEYRPCVFEDKQSTMFLKITLFYILFNKHTKVAESISADRDIGLSFCAHQKDTQSIKVVRRDKIGCVTEGCSAEGTYGTEKSYAATGSM